MFNFLKKREPKQEPEHFMQPLIDATIRWRIESEYQKKQEEIIKIHETTIEKQKQLITEQKEQIAILQEITSLYEKKTNHLKPTNKTIPMLLIVNIGIFF